MAIADTPSGTDEFHSEEADIEAFRKSFDVEDPKKRVAPTEDEGAGTTDDATETEGTEGEETQDGDKDAPSEDADDQSEEGEEDPEFSVKQGDKEHKVKLSALKRLYGQEAALTQKSQAVAEKLKVTEAAISRNVEAYNILLQRAEEAYKPYAEFDQAAWALLANSMDTESFNALREEERKARGNVDFLKSEMQNHMKAVSETQNASRIETAKATIQALSNPETGIKGFGAEMWQEMGTFVGRHGITQEQFNQAVSEPELRIIWKAMQYDKAQEAAKKAAKKVTEVKNNPTRLLRPGPSRPAKTDQDFKAALKKLATTGDDDDAVEAFRKSF